MTPSPTSLPSRGLRLLLVNPNTSVHITERLAASARTALQPGDSLTALTATSGPAVVRSAEGLAEAELSALALVAGHAAGHDGVLLGISVDAAAVALRQRHPGLPVVGMTEAALMSACLRVDGVGLLTLGAAMLPLYRARVAQVGLAQRVLAYEAPESPTAYMAGTDLVDPAVLDVLTAACASLQRGGAQAVVLAGAVLCGYAPALSARTGLPVFDGAACAVGQLRILCQQTFSQPAPAEPAPDKGVPDAT